MAYLAQSGIIKIDYTKTQQALYTTLSESYHTLIAIVGEINKSLDQHTDIIAAGTVGFGFGMLMGLKHN
jgi:hypothetical protein